MSKRWTELYSIYATYESDVIDISSDFDYYITKINTKYQSNDGNITVEVRSSFDGGSTWSEWYHVNNAKKVFDGNESYMKRAKFQYRVLMEVDTILGGQSISPIFEIFSINLVGAFKITNHGDVVCKPDIWITKKNGFGTVRIINETNGQVMEIQDLNNGETVFIDCENEDIVTDLPRVYRYNNHNNVFLKLEVGENLICGEGDFELNMRYEFKTLQG